MHTALKSLVQRYPLPCYAMLAMAIVFAIYLPGLPGGFIFDDTPNLIKNYRFKLHDYSLESFITAIFSSLSGPTGRPVSMFSFVVNQVFSGLENPAPYKLTNIAIHAINSVLALYFVSALLTARATSRAITNKQPLDYNKIHAIAALCAIFWAIHPMQLTSVLYIVQRMTALAFCFTLLSLIAYLHGRRLMMAGETKRGWVYSLGLGGLFGALAVLSKETALLFPLFWLLSECVAYGWRGSSSGPLANWRLSWLANHAINRPLLWFFIGGAICAVVAVIGVLLFSPETIFAAYNQRSFSWQERLMTEARVLWFYLYLFILPNISNMGLYHDDIVVSSGLLQPASTMAAIAAWLFLLSALPWIWRRWPLLAFGVAWYLGGHLLESTIWPLEIAHEHRNYLPSLGLMLALANALGEGIASLTTRKIANSAVLTLCLFLLAGSTVIRARDWSQPHRHALLEGVNHPGSARALYDAGRSYFSTYELTKKKKYYQEAIEHLRASTRVGRPGIEIAFLGLVFAPFQVGQYPQQDDLAAFAERLKISPACALNAYNLEYIVDCQIGNQCQLKDDDILRLFRALFENPHLDNKIAARLHVTLGAYYANSSDNLLKAGQQFYTATRKAPGDIDSRLHYIGYLTSIRLYDMAQDELQVANKLPNAWKYQYTLSRAQQKLDRMRKEKPSPDLQLHDGVTLPGGASLPPASNSAKGKK